MKKNNIIALRCSKDTGKTNTIKLFSQLLQEKHPNTILLDYYPETPHDIKFIFEIGKFKVGIESQGDPNSRLCKSLEEFVQKKCDIIVCATRTRGQTVKFVESYSHSYNIKFIDKHKEFDKNKQDESNHEYARKLLEYVSDIIKDY